MKLLVVSFHYPPDLGAGAFRVKSLVDALRSIGGERLAIDVLTAQPHRYPGFRPATEPVERQGTVSIFRFPVPLSRGRKAALARSYLKFGQKCLHHAKQHGGDAVFASASRLGPVVVGAFLAHQLRAYLHLDFRDCFAENLRDMHPGIGWMPVNWVISRVESWTIRKAHSISLVSSSFRDHMPEILSRIPTAVYPNGIDSEFVAENDDAYPQIDVNGKLEIVYAGNIGRAQGLELIIPELAAHLKERAIFSIYGDGSAKPALRRRLEQLNIENVRLLGPVARNQLPAIYRRAHALFLHLRPLAALEAAIPSKIFEYAASARPILGGVSGVAAQLLADEVSNSAVFSPCNAGSAIEAFNRLRFCHTQRLEFIARYDRKKIAAEMGQFLLNRLRLSGSL
jgi:hypothetical protein